MNYYTTSLSQFLSSDEFAIFSEEVSAPHPPHAHDFIEIVYIASGRGTHIVNGDEIEVFGGDLFLINQNIVHEFVPGEGATLLVYNYVFEPLLIGSEFGGSKDFVDVAYKYLIHSMNDSHPSDYIRIKGLKGHQIERVLFDMHSEYYAKKGGYVQVIKAQLITLLIYMFRQFKDDSDQKQNSPVYKRLIVDSAVSYLKAHYNEDVKCDVLAQKAYLSKNYFSVMFKEVTGMTIIAMLQNIRVNVACNLLEGGALSVADVALAVGYSDLKYFYSLFRKMRGMTPAEYRKRHLK